jgi:riboflavin synthase
MFTGLVESVGEVVENQPTAGGFHLRIATRLASELGEGDSLAVNGVCLTVVGADRGEVRADVGPQTALVTTLGGLVRGTAVNLERPLRADGRFGGHIVQGHVDAVGHLEERRPDGEFEWFTFSFPPHLAAYLVVKGSVAVDGVSLTAARLGPDRFDVQVIPFTLSHTNLGAMGVRDPVNIECDMVGKYVVRAASLGWPSGVNLGEGAR